MRTLQHVMMALCCVCLLVFGATGCEKKKADAPPKNSVKQKIPAAKQAPKDQAKAGKKVGPDAGTPVKEQKKDVAATPSPSPATAEQPSEASPGESSGATGAEAAEENVDLTAAEADSADTPATSAEAMSADSAETPDLIDLEEATSADNVPVALAEEPVQFDLDLGDEENEALAAEEEAAAYNPFAPLFRKKKAMLQQESGAADDPRSNRAFLTPLEQIGLGQITLEGIILAQSGNRAIVTDASGKGYVLKKGTYVGLNSGRVEKITEDRVDIVEIIGGRRTVTKLELQKAAGE